MTRRRSIRLALLFICAISVAAQELPKLSRPEEAGFASDRLNRITQFFQSEVDKGAIPGAVLVVARNGKTVYRQAIGYQDREKKIPMKVDSVFRIFSMTKPVTSVAVMMLAEEGKIDVMAPVAQYLPEFKDVKVGVEKMDPAGGKPYLAFEPPGRAMTVQDLLRHTSGLVYGPFGNSLVHQEYNKANLFDPGQTLAEFVSKLAKLPLAHQPGTVFGIRDEHRRARTDCGSRLGDAFRSLCGRARHQALEDARHCVLHGPGKVAARGAVAD